MSDKFSQFEKFARSSINYGPKPDKDQQIDSEIEGPTHPFDERNIHPEIALVALKLYNDGHYSQAVVEAYKYLDKQVSQLSKIKNTGFSLMMQAFDEKTPQIKLNDLTDMSKEDEQRGFRYIFAGAIAGIRNPRAHEVGNIDTIEQCLDYLSFASLLTRKLNDRIDP